MSNAIRFLESMGANPAMARLSAAEYRATVELLDVDDAERDALLSRDAIALNGLLGGRSKMYCSQYPARENQPHREQEEKEPKEQPDDEEAEES